MTESELQARGKWFVALASLTIIALAFGFSYLYGTYHWHGVDNQGILTHHDSLSWGSMLMRIDICRKIASVTAVIFAIWARQQLPPTRLRDGILILAIIALINGFLVM